MNPDNYSTYQDNPAEQKPEYNKRMTTKQRPSPTESATVFEIGTLRRGNDGNMYVVMTDKNGKYRWAKHKGKDDEETAVDQVILENAPKRKAQPKKKPAPDAVVPIEPETPPNVPKRKGQPKKKAAPAEPEAEEEPKAEKKKHVRKAPAEPAKNYEVGETKKGVDGRMYVVKEIKNEVKRWVLEH